MPYRIGKWTKYKALIRSAKLRDSLPHTRPFNQDNLRFMLSKYQALIIKPSGGSGGKGVLKISARSSRQYVIHSNKTVATRHGLHSAYAYIQKKNQGAPMIIQQYIPLASIGRRPFDLRIMVQRSRHTGWTVTGRLVKVAGPGFIITNTARSGGRVLPLSAAIRKSNITGKDAARIQKQADRLALRSAHCLHRPYPKIRTLGMDIGLDRSGKPWLIEANFKPSKSLFKLLPDQSAYRRILSFSK